MIKQGFLDTLDDNSKLNEQDMAAVLMAFQQELQQKIVEKQEAANNTYLQQHAAQEGVQITESGLQYRMLSEGTGPMPKSGDIVRVHYKGTLIDGAEFDNSIARNKPEEFEVDAVIPGWAEGIKLVKEGGKIELVMGPDLGYGGMETPTIPPYSVLTFEVELLKVNPEPETPETEPAAEAAGPEKSEEADNDKDGGS